MHLLISRYLLPCTASPFVDSEGIFLVGAAPVSTGTPGCASSWPCHGCGICFHGMFAVITPLIGTKLHQTEQQKPPRSCLDTWSSNWKARAHELLFTERHSLKTFEKSSFKKPSEVVPESKRAWRLNSAPACTQCNSELNGVILVKKKGLRSWARRSHMRTKGVFFS